MSLLPYPDYEMKLQLTFLADYFILAVKKFQ